MGPGMFDDIWDGLMQMAVICILLACGIGTAIGYWVIPQLLKISVSIAP